MPSHTSQKSCPARVKPSPRGRLARWTCNKSPNGVSSERRPLPAWIPARWTHPIKDIPIFFEFPSPLMLWQTSKNTCPNGTKPAPSLPFPRLDTPKPAPTHVQTAEAAPSKGFSRLDTAQQEDTPCLRANPSHQTLLDKRHLPEKLSSVSKPSPHKAFTRWTRF